MAKDQARAGNGIFGDIDPAPEPDVSREPVNRDNSDSNNAPMAGGSKHDRTKHPGTRDVTEGVTGGLGTETGGTRNYRSGTGATGGDIGNRPE